VGDFITKDKRWNLDRLTEVLPHHPIIHRILGVPLPISDVVYSFSWGCTSSGEFSIKSATWLTHGLNPTTVQP